MADQVTTNASLSLFCVFSFVFPSVRTRKSVVQSARDRFPSCILALSLQRALNGPSWSWLSEARLQQFAEHLDESRVLYTRAELGAGASPIIGMPFLGRTRRDPLEARTGPIGPLPHAGCVSRSPLEREIVAYRRYFGDR